MIKNNKINILKFSILINKKKIQILSEKNKIVKNNFIKKYLIIVNYGIEIITKSIAISITVTKILKNLIIGIFKKFSKVIVTDGSEYKVLKKKDKIDLYIGYSNKISIKIPDKISCKIIENKIIVLQCREKEKLGLFCGKIIKLKKYNIYKGKGLRYKNEKIKLKKGKK